MLSILFSYKGRINRAQYWTGLALVCVFLFVAFFTMAMMAGSALIPGKAESMAAVQQAMATTGMIFVPAMLIYCWCAFAIQTKRFHDRGRSGAWSLLPMVATVPLFLALVGGIVSGKTVAQISQEVQLWFTILSLINLGMLIDLGFMPGKDGPNKYGDPPGGQSRSPSYSAPAAPKPSSTQAAASSLLSAQSAIDRAIADRAREAQRPQPAPKAAKAPQPAAPRPAIGGAPSFGRRTAH